MKHGIPDLFSGVLLNIVSIAAGAVAIAAAGGLLPSLLVANSFAQGQAQGKGRGKGKAKAPSRPTPHWPDGRVNFGPMPGEKGDWASSGGGTTLATNVNGVVANNLINLPTNLRIPDVPFLPWARALYDYRRRSSRRTIRTCVVRPPVVRACITRRMGLRLSTFRRCSRSS
jgi:hypothetical protein